MSTADIAGERDWFDLRVTIAVEGRELPFAEVFAALASGESHMLLEDGAHLSLLEPRLQSLRALIEEARALTESPSALRISRYQVVVPAGGTGASLISMARSGTHPEGGQSAANTQTTNASGRAALRGMSPAQPSCHSVSPISWYRHDKHRPSDRTTVRRSGWSNHDLVATSRGPRMVLRLAPRPIP